MLTEADRAAWLAMRNNYVGASDIGVLFGVHPFKTPLRLWGEKTGRIAPEPENRYMRVGSQMESIIASEYCLETGREVYPDHWEPTRASDRFQVHRFGPLAMYSHVDCPASCTPDRIVRDTRNASADMFGGCQLKWRALPYGEDWKVIDGLVNVPMRTQMQVQMEIGILGLNWGSAAALVGGKLVYRDFARNEKFFEAAQLKAAQFMHYVKHDKQPPDVTPDDRETLCALYPEQIPGKVIALPEEAAKITERYELAQAAVDHHQSIVDHCKAEIQAMLGDAEKGIVPGDMGAWTWKHQGECVIKEHIRKASRPLRRTKK